MGITIGRLALLINMLKDFVLEGKSRLSVWNELV